MFVILAHLRVGTRRKWAGILHTAMQHVAIAQWCIGAAQSFATADEVLSHARIAITPFSGTIIGLSRPSSLEAKPGSDVATITRCSLAEVGVIVPKWGS